MQPTKAELKIAFDLCKVALETIVSAGPDGIPSGHLYAAMMSVFSSVHTYESMIALLIRSKLITRASNHVLTASV